MTTKTKLEEEYRNMENVITMNDIDAKYFTELADRVIKEKFMLHKYVEDTRQVLRTKLLLGHARDNIICIDQQYVEEQRRFGNIQRQYWRYTNQFEEFLSRNHAKSKNILNKVEEDAKQTRATVETVNKLSKCFGQIRLEVYQCEENWRIMKMCQKFLYLISPDSWRLEHDWLHYIVSKETIASFTNDALDCYKISEEAASLDTLIDLFEQDIRDVGTTEIYFQNSSDLIHAFRSMESQNMNALIYLESLTAPMTEMEMTYVQAEALIKQEINEISERIQGLEAIHTEEERAAVLEGYINKLLFEIFQELVCSTDVLYLHVFIENTYEICIASNDANLDSFTMMKQIEKHHEDLNMQLDGLPYAAVEASEKEGFKQEMKAMREAAAAAKKFDLMKRLLDTLKRIMEPILAKGRPLMQRSVPILKKSGAIRAVPELTEEQRQFLTFFAEYCSLNKASYCDFSEDFNLLKEMQEHEIFVKSLYYDEGNKNHIKET